MLSKYSFREISFKQALGHLLIGSGKISKTVPRGFHMRKVFVLVLSFFLIQDIANAADGDVDFGFGFGGTVVTDFGAFDRLTDLAVQPDGRVIAAGSSCTPPIPVCNLVLARYNSNGQPDATFGNFGRVVVPLFAHQFAAVAIQP